MIAQDIKDITNKPKPDKDGFLRAYKIIYDREEPHITEYAKEYCNFWKNNCDLRDYTFVYQIGTNVFKNREAYSNEVNKNDIVREGFRLILTLKDANEWIKMNYQKAIEVYYRPEDVITYGFLQGTKTQGVIVKQITVKSLEGTK
jgi:hypothetical protein